MDTAKWVITNKMVLIKNIDSTQSIQTNAVLAFHQITLSKKNISCSE